MSLRGRHIIDRIKRSRFGRYFSLPVPPYENPNYWEGVYRSLGPNDVFEWGNVSYDNLKEYRYQKVRYNLFEDEATNDDEDYGPVQSISLGNTLGIYARNPDTKNSTEEEEPLLMLGCGNSKLGEDMLQAGWKGPVLQVDIASRVIDSMSYRCSHYVQSGDMQLIQDDATILSAFNDNKIAAAIDKGLTDALYTADEFQQCYDVMTSVHRVLKPNSNVCIFSLSRPEYILPKLLLSPLDGGSGGSTNAMMIYYNNPHIQNKIHNMWSNIQIQRLDTIFLYRFTKAKPRHSSSSASSSSQRSARKYRR